LPQILDEMPAIRLLPLNCFLEKSKLV